MSGLAPPADKLIVDENWATVGRVVADVAFGHESKWRWWIAFAVSIALMGMLALCVGWLLIEGVGIWGNNVPVTWALDIVGYDWWIGVASGGLVVSAMLLLLGTEWRGAINRLAETMALISAAAAGLYPIIHLGRPWFFYWNIPYPNTFLLYPQVRSPLFWDAVDIISYLLICLCFWYVGLLPDLAGMRDRAIEAMLRNEGRPGGWTRRLKAQLYGITALGWRGSAAHWQRWEHTYRTLGAFGIVLVASLQTGAAVMFAGTVEPGWHDSILPVSYLFGALLSGVAVVAVLLVVVRSVFPLRELLTIRHVNLLGWLLLGLAVANLYCYAASFLTSALTGSGFEHGVLTRRFNGPHAWSTWALILCALLPPHLFWFPPLRRSGAALLIVGVLAAFGMWADHFMLIVVTLQHDFLPSAAHPYAMNLVALATFVGTAGLFLFLLLLFLRYVPMVSIVGLRRVVPALGVPGG